MLDGAKALALPTRYGQSLKMEPASSGKPELDWESYDHAGKRWFSGTFALPSGKYLKGSNDEVGAALGSLLRSARRQRPDSLAIPSARVSTRLDFPRHWGLGSSSTLIVNIARWLSVDPYQLLADSFGGSGYDLACALAARPIIYQRTELGPRTEPVNFIPAFRHQLYFIYLEQKQNSREGIQRYRETVGRQPELIDRINRLTLQALEAAELADFQHFIYEHERLVGQALDLQPVGDRLFPDFRGAVKSLGAWGGDFIMAATDRAETEIKDYFSRRAYSTVLTFDEMIKGQ